MRQVKCSPELTPHPTADGWVQGWAVLLSNRTTWDLRAVHALKVEADKEAAEIGSSYEVVWGYFRPETEDFMHGGPIDSTALPLVA